MRLNMDGWPVLRVQLVIAIIAMAAVLGVGTVAYHLMESWSWLDSFYFATCTLTTVGYGDLAPTTDASKLFTAFYVLVGVSIAFTTIGLLGAGYIRRSERVLSGAARDP